MKLSLETIDEQNKKLSEELSALKVERRTIVSIRLSFEEAMLRFIDRFGEGIDVNVAVRNNLSGARVQVECAGEAYNPLGMSDEGSWFVSPMTSIGYKPQYSYVNGVNVLRLPFSRSRMNPVVKLFIGVAIGMVAGMVGLSIFPGEMAARIGHAVFSPFFTLWRRILNAIAGPVVFLMVVSAMLSMRDIQARGGDDRVMTLRYFAMSYLAGSIAVIVAAVAFRIRIDGHGLDSLNASVVLGAVANIIPENVVDPFITSNTPQLLLFSFVFGGALTAMYDRIPETVVVIRQLSDVMLLITRWVSNLVPLVIGFIIAMEIWQGWGLVIYMLPQPLLLSVGVSLAFILIELVLNSRSFGVPLRLLAKKVWKPFYKTILAGNLDDVYEDAQYSCVQALGMDEKFTSVALPQGLIMYMPASFVGTLILTCMYEPISATGGTISWFIIAILLDIVLFVAAPPVPGANLLAFITLFSVLGIPEEVLPDAMVFDILFGLIANAANQTMLQMEMLRQARHMGLLDEKALHSETV
ncbi:MAG: cation:dicarboxylase symporter family transporter [Coriobacteriales bacterium]|nr:cation:dicarboxylase symporter family transporter [Coriobacteriales bacterium]